MNDTEHTVHSIVRRAKKEQEHNEHEKKRRVHGSTFMSIEFQR